MKTKDCRCQFSKDFEFMIRLLPNVPERFRKQLEEFFHRAWTEQEDADYNNCILDGSWPSSVEQLERALENAKKRREQSCQTK